MSANVEPVVKRVSTYCYQCVNGPDLLTVETVDGVATKVEPNFDLQGEHPADGKVCVKPFGLVQKLYNPHRIKRPMKRTNPKGLTQTLPSAGCSPWRSKLGSTLVATPSTVSTVSRSGPLTHW